MLNKSIAGVCAFSSSVLDLPTNQGKELEPNILAAPLHVPGKSVVHFECLDVDAVDVVLVHASGSTEVDVLRKHDRSRRGGSRGKATAFPEALNRNGQEKRQCCGAQQSHQQKNNLRQRKCSRRH